jgi:hypothetical protein
VNEQHERSPSDRQTDPSAWMTKDAGMAWHQAGRMVVGFVCPREMTVLLHLSSDPLTWALEASRKFAAYFDPAP